MSSAAFSLFNQPTTALLNPLDIEAKKNSLAVSAMQYRQMQQAIADQQQNRASLLGVANGQAAPAPAAPPPANALAPTPDSGALPFSPQTGMQGYSDGSGIAAGLPPQTSLDMGAPAQPAAAPAQPAVAAPAPQPAAAPRARPAPLDYLDLIRRGMTPEMAKEVSDTSLKNSSTLATIEKTNAETQKSVLESQTAANDLVGGSANAIIQSNYDPAVIQHQLDGFASLGPHYAGLAANVEAQIAANPADAPKIFKALLDTSDKQRAAAAADMTARAHKQTSDSTAIKDADALVGTQLQRSAQLLSSTGGDPKAYATVWNALEAKSPGALKASGFDAPAAWTPQSPAKAQTIGMTPEQKTAAAQAAASQAETAGYHKGELAQGAQRIGIERDNAQVARAAADPWGTLGLNSKPMGGGNGTNLQGQAFLATLPSQFAATVKAVSEGRQTNLPRGGKELDLLMGAVNQYDPTYSKQRAEIRSAYTTGVQGRNIENLNTAAVHLDQYHEVMKAMNNGTFQPGNQLFNWAAEKLGAANVTNPSFVRQSLAGEAANALKGNATDPEIAGLMKTLSSNASPKQQEGTALEGLRILGAKLNTYDEHYQQLSPGDPWSPVLPSARAVFARYKIQPLARTGEAPAASAPGGAPAAAAPAAAVPPHIGALRVKYKY